MKLNDILVAGLVNIETTASINKFPIEYTPIHYEFFGVNQGVSGVGSNIAKALTCLGDQVHLLSFIGKDITGDIVVNSLQKQGISTKYIIPDLSETPQSVVLYDEKGKREILCDLKEIQDISYDEKIFEEAATNVSLVVLCNINFARPLLLKAREMNKLIATDVHVIGDINDSYNSDFMKYADILFMSDENIIGSVKKFIMQVSKQYDNKIIVVGRGNKGALLYVREDKCIRYYKAVDTRKIISTVGAGDALFSSFLHYYLKTENPYLALENAILFSSYKIGAKGAAEGFLTEQELEELKKS